MAVVDSFSGRCPVCGGIGSKSRLPRLMAEKVTRVLHSQGLNAAKYDRLARIAVLCGQVRADAWQRCSGVSTVLQSPYDIRDAWMAEEYDWHGLPARLGKATLADARHQAGAGGGQGAGQEGHPAPHAGRQGRTRASVQPAQAEPLIRSCTGRSTVARRPVPCDQPDRGRLGLLHHQGLARPAWVYLQSLERGQRIAIPLKGTHLPSGTLRILLQATAGGTTVSCSTRPCGEATVGVDKGSLHRQRRGMAIGRPVVRVARSTAQSPQQGRPSGSSGPAADAAPQASARPPLPVTPSWTSTPSPARTCPRQSAPSGTPTAGSAVGSRAHGGHPNLDISAQRFFVNPAYTSSTWPVAGHGTGFTVATGLCWTGRQCRLQHSGEADEEITMPYREVKAPRRTNQDSGGDCSTRTRVAGATPPPSRAKYQRRYRSVPINGNAPFTGRWPPPTTRRAWSILTPEMAMPSGNLPGFCAPSQGVPPNLRNSRSPRTGTGQGAPEPTRSPYTPKPRTILVADPKPFLPQPANFPHADRHPGEATHRGAATALPQSTPDHRADLKQDTGFGPHRSNHFGYHVSSHPVREEKHMSGSSQQPLLGNYEFQVTWSMADMFGYRLLGSRLAWHRSAPYAWAAKLLNGCEVRDRSGNRLGTLQVAWSTFCCGYCSRSSRSAWRGSSTTLEWPGPF